MPNPSDRRRHERYASRGDAFAVLRHSVPRLGQIIDISRGGMSFRYVDGSGAISERADMDIFLLNRPVLMKSVPVRSCSDFQIEGVGRSETVRRCCVEFLDLEPRQASALDELIEHHSNPAA